MNSKITCKTCSKESVPDWNGKGQCITCSRNEVMNSKLRTILEKLGMTEFHNGRTGSGVLSTAVDEAEKAIRQAVGEEMLELINDYPPHCIYGQMNCAQCRNREQRNYQNYELRQKIKQWSKEPSNE